jgi:hypothetical protein
LLNTEIWKKENYGAARSAGSASRCKQILVSGSRMLIHLQFPVVDLRDMSNAPEARLPVPGFPAPLVDEEFIRSTGIIRRRPSGGLKGFVAEEVYCDARQSIKFDSRSITAAGLAPWRFKIAFRRFYFDGTAVGKFEVGLATDKPLPSERRDALNELLSSLFLLPVRIRHLGKGSLNCRLFESGRALATLYASASSRHHGHGSIKWFRRKPNTESLIVPAIPAVFIEIAPEHFNIENLPHPVHKLEMKDTDLRLFYWRNMIDGRSIPVWTAVHPEYKEIADARKLRLYLLRLNAEYQTLVRVLKAINSDQINPEPRSAKSDVLQNCLNQATSKVIELSAKSREFASGNDRLLIVRSDRCRDFSFSRRAPISVKPSA